MLLLQALIFANYIRLGMGMQTRWFESIPIYLKPMRFSEIRGVSKWYLPNTIIFYSVWKIRPLNKYF